MKQLFRENRGRRFLAIMIFWLVMGTLSPSQVVGEHSSGMILELFVDRDPPVYELDAGDSISLIMKLKNVSGSLIYTDIGFSPNELPRSLIVRAPNEKIYSAMTGEGQTTEPGPPYLYRSKTAVSVQEIEPGYEKHVSIQDLRDIFPVMDTRPGWYIIEAQQPFARYLWTVEDELLGRLGITDHPNNWFGTINSENKLAIFISPDSGAQLHVQVLDRSFQPPKPLENVSVKVFKTNEIPPELELAQAWVQVNPVLDGATNSEGWAFKDSGTPCMPEDQYTAIASHHGDYRVVFFEPGGEGAGWAPGCGAILVRKFLLGEPPTLTGACCLPDGSCSESRQDECTKAGGDYQGDGTDCASTSCPLRACACDLNDDGICDEQDLTIFSNSPGWNDWDCNRLEVDCICDLNHDGTCDDLDGTIFTEAYERPQCQYKVCECEIYPDATVIPRGGTLEFKATVTNKTDKPQSVLFATNVTMPNRKKYPPSGYLDGPFRVHLGPHQSRSGNISLTIPGSASVGAYTYHGYIGRSNLGVIAECEFSFEVTMP